MEILLWLLPATLTTAVAMFWVGWIGRERPERERTDAEHERFARAIQRPLPRSTPRPRQRERSTGVAVRPSVAAPSTSRRSA